jgi:uncharacterized protein
MTTPSHTVPRPYTPRIVDTVLSRLLSGVGAVSLEGAKAIGKTATATRLSERTVRLDVPAVSAVVAADPDEAVRPPYPVFFDEWQHVPAIWDAVRRSVDTDPTPGRVLLAGSGGWPRAARPTHSGAGRIVTIRMRPMVISERLDADGLLASERSVISVAALLGQGDRPHLHGESPWSLKDYARQIVASGFPGIRSLAPELRNALLESYVNHLLTRDVRESTGAAANPAIAERWIRACAAATGTSTSLEKLRDLATAGDGPPVARTTALRYRDALERLFVYDPVPAWKPGGTALSRLGEAAKIHLVDPALSAHLLGMDEGALLDGETPTVPLAPRVRDGGVFGALFESLVAQAMRTYARAADAQHRHVRTYAGEHEVDGILLRRDQRCVAYEVKLAATVTDRDVAHLHWLKSQLGDQLLDAIVVHTGPAAYRRADGIGVVPAAMLVP